MIKKFLIFGVFFIVIATIVGFFLINKNNYKNEILVDKPVVRVGAGVSELSSAPLVLAIEQNFFNKYGIKVEVLPFKSGEEISTALSLGQIDVGFSSVNSLSIPLAKGGPIKLVGFSFKTPAYLFVRPDRVVESLNDLVGESVVSRKGSSADLLFRKVLKERGINSDQITFLDMEASVRPIALMEKKVVNAVTVPGGEELFFIQAGAVVMKEWLDGGYDQIGISRVFAMNTDFLAKYPELAEAFVHGYIDGQRFIVSEKETAADLLSKILFKESEGTNNLTPEEILEVWSTKQMVYILWDKTEAIVDLVAVGNDLGQIERALTADDLFDFRFQTILEMAQKEIYGTED